MIPQYQPIMVGRIRLDAVIDKIRQCIRIPHVPDFHGFHGGYPILCQRKSGIGYTIHFIQLPPGGTACLNHHMKRGKIFLLSRRPQGIHHFPEVRCGCSIIPFQVASVHVNHDCTVRRLCGLCILLYLYALTLRAAHRIESGTCQQGAQGRRDSRRSDPLSFFIHLPISFSLSVQNHFSASCFNASHLACSQPTACCHTCPCGSCSSLRAHFQKPGPQIPAWPRPYTGESILPGKD